METKKTEVINLNELKQVVHTGLLDAIVSLRQSRDKINALTDDEELCQYTSIEKELANISEGLMLFGCKLSKAIGELFIDGVESKLDELTKK